MRCPKHPKGELQETAAGLYCGKCDEHIVLFNQAVDLLAPAE